MNVVFLNTESTVTVHSKTLPKTPLSYLFSHTFTEDEEVIFSNAATSKTLSFPLSTRSLIYPPKEFSVYAGRGSLRGTWFLKWKRRTPQEDLPLDRARKSDLPDRAEGLYFGEGKGFGEGGFYRVFRSDKTQIFCGTADKFSVDSTARTFTVTRTLSDYCRHETRVRRSFSDGKITAYSVRKTRNFDPYETPPLLLPFTFLEEAFVSGAVEDYLSASLRPRATEVAEFLGDFEGFLPATKPNQAVLLRPYRAAELVLFRIREGRVFGLSVDDGNEA